MTSRKEELELEKKRIERELTHQEAAARLRTEYPWLGPYSCNPDIHGIDIRFMSLDPEDARELVAVRHAQRVRRGESVTGRDPKVVVEPVVQTGRAVPDGMPAKVERVSVDLGDEGKLPPVVTEGPRG